MIISILVLTTKFLISSRVFFYINQRFVCDFNYAMNCCRDTRTDLEFNFNFFYSQKLYELYKYINVNNYYNIEIFQFEK